MNQKIEVSVSWETLGKIVAVLLGLLLLFRIKEIVLVFLTALIFASAIETWATNFSRRSRIPYSACVALIFFLLVFVLGFILYIIFPIVIHQVQVAAPRLLELIKGNYEIDVPFLDDFIPSITKEASKYLSGITESLFDVFGGLIDLLLIFAISFYLSIQGETIPLILRTLFGDNARDLIHVWAISQRKFTDWLTAQVVLMTLVGSLTYIAMAFLDVPNAPLIGIVAGLTEIIPFVGPIIGGLFAALFALSKGADALGLAIGAIVLIQQFEAHAIIPNLMQKTTSLNPVLVIVSLLVGQTIAGPAGALIAIPILSAILEVLKEKRAQQESGI